MKRASYNGTAWPEWEYCICFLYAQEPLEDCSGLLVLILSVSWSVGLYKYALKMCKQWGCNDCFSWIEATGQRSSLVTKHSCFFKNIYLTTGFGSKWLMLPWHWCALEQGSKLHLLKTVDVLCSSGPITLWLWCRKRKQQDSNYSKESDQYLYLAVSFKFEFSVVQSANWRDVDYNLNSRSFFCWGFYIML